MIYYCTFHIPCKLVGDSDTEPAMSHPLCKLPYHVIITSLHALVIFPSPCNDSLHTLVIFPSACNNFTPCFVYTSFHSSIVSQIMVQSTQKHTQCYIWKNSALWIERCMLSSTCSLWIHKIMHNNTYIYNNVCTRNNFHAQLLKKKLTHLPKASIILTKTLS